MMAVQRAAWWSRAEAAWRKGRAGPGLVADRLALAGVLGATLLAAAAILLASPSQPELQFLEGGAVTVMTSLLLSVCAAYALAGFHIRMRDRDLPALFWLLASAAFAFLAVDEHLEIHERVADFVSDAYGESSVFRNWNDLIVIAYGLAGLGCALVFCNEVVRWTRMLEFLAIGFLFFVLHTAIDSLVVDATPFSIICEESAKLFAVTFLAAGFGAGLLSVFEDALANRAGVPNHGAHS